MNRYVTIPGAMIVAMFLAVTASLDAGRGAEDSDSPALPGTIEAPARAYQASDPAKPAFTNGLPENGKETASPEKEPRIEPAEKAIRSLADSFTRPWREYEKSPGRLLSRAGPRPVPPIASEVVMFPEATGPSDGYRVASITVRYRNTTNTFPCVVDAATLRVRIFASKHWISEKEWLLLAPLP